MHRSTFLKKWNYRFTAMAVLLASLILIRLTLPLIGKYYINRSLANDLAHYSGQIEDLSLSLLTGSYVIKNLTVRKKIAAIHRPFLVVENLKVSISWRMLFKGMVSMDVVVEKSILNFLDSEDNTKKQAGLEAEPTQHWSDALDSIVPLSIETLVVSDLLITFENTDIKGSERLELQVASMEVSNLLDPHNGPHQLSPLSVRARLNSDADLNIDGGIDITKENPELDIDLKFGQYDLIKSNKLFMHYVPVDLSSGKVTVLGEIKGSTHNGKGYLRVFLENLDILEFNQSYKSFKHFGFEWVGGFINWALQVLTDHKLATEIPFSIKNGETSFDSSEAFWNTLENVGEKLPEDFKNL